MGSKMKIVYIAGQLTTGWDGKDREFIAQRIREAEKYQIALINNGIGCFCSHSHTSFHHEKGSKASEEFYYELGLEFLKRTSDAVLAMPGWEKSRGAKMEVGWATKNKLPVFYPKSPDDIGGIIEWSRKKL